jgi:hypothetical protein
MAALDMAHIIKEIWLTTEEAMSIHLRLKVVDPDCDPREVIYLSRLNDHNKAFNRAVSFIRKRSPVTEVEVIESRQIRKGEVVWRLTCPENEISKGS